MNKLSIYIIILLIFFLTACGNMQVDPTQTNNDDLPVVSQLVLGTLKLDGSDQAVTTDQASELLVMWQVYEELNSSDTAAQEEIDGLVEQIQETMTAEQAKSILAMNLTQQDVFTLMQEQGIGMGQVRQSSSSSGSTQSGGGFAPPEGGNPGGPPDGGGMVGGAPPEGGVGGDIAVAGSSTSTGQSQNAGAGPSFGGTAGVPTALVDALIQYLEQITSS
jgi:hypothetical protein